MTNNKNKSETVDLIYTCKVDDIDNVETVNTVLTKLDRSKILELKDIISVKPETHESWLVSDNAKQRIMIWGRLKLNLDVDIYGFKDYNIEFVKNAVNGCPKAFANLELDALLYAGYNSYALPKGYIECRDYEISPAKALKSHYCPQQLLIVRELVEKYRNG